MLRNQTMLALLCGLLAAAACNPDKPMVTSEEEIRSVDTTFESRGVDVPATLVMPAAGGGEPKPLVVMAHGHGGSRQEGGGYGLVAEAMARHRLDARYLLCPLPVIRTQQKMKDLAPGDLLEVVCTDPGALYDIPAWCRVHGHRLVSTREADDLIYVEVEAQGS